MSEHASIFFPSARSGDMQAAVPTAEICMAMPRGCRYDRGACSPQMTEIGATPFRKRDLRN